MNRLRARCVLLTCAAIASSDTLLAQARTPVSKAPRIESYIDPRVAKEFGTGDCDIRGVLGSAPDDPCFANARSRSVARAWKKGLDENGVPLDAAAPARKLAEMEIWLRRLAGTYRIEGTYRNHGGSSQVRGSAKCFGVGGGPGVSCVIAATWKAHKESFRDPQFDNTLHNVMQSLVIIFGIDPDSSQIRATLMDYRAVKTRGFLVDDEVAFGGESWRFYDSSTPLVPHLWNSSLVAIKPDGDVDMKFALMPSSNEYWLAGTGILKGQVFSNTGIGFNMQLHREPSVGVDTPRNSP